MKRIDDVGRDGIKADSEQEDVEDEMYSAFYYCNIFSDEAEDLKEREMRRQALADFYEKVRVACYALIVSLLGY